MKTIAYILIGLLYFYTAYRSLVGNVYSKKSIIIDTFIIFFLAVSTFLAKSNTEYIICLIGNVFFFLFEVLDTVIYHKKDVSSCLHTKKPVYGAVILCCVINIVAFLVKHYQ